MLTGVFLSIAISTAAVPPGYAVDNHAHPGHFTQPTLRRFERQPVDDLRRGNWECYCRDLEILWRNYREAGSTAQAWREYNAAVTEAKRRYVYADPYLAPVLPYSATK